MRIIAVFVLLSTAFGYCHLCDNVFRQADKLIVKPETYNLVVKDSTTFKIFLQNNMDRGIAEISLLADSPAFDFNITPQKMTIPKDQRAYFSVTMTPKSSTKTGNYSINFRLVGGGRQFKTFSLTTEGGGGVAKSKDTSSLLKVKYVSGTPKIDGLLNDPGWKSASVASNFISAKGGEPANRTIALLFYDKTYLYCAVCCIDDNPSKVPDTDRVEIQLAPTASDRPVRSFIFYAGGSISGNNQGVRYAVSRGVTSWTAECAIPLAAFGAEVPSSETVWSLKIIRVKNGERPEESFWAADSEYHNEKGLGRIVILP